MRCIDTDVRGNIKLSLKALLPKPEAKSASAPEKIPVVMKDTVSIETSSFGETVASLPSVVEPPQKSKLAVPAVVIRTAVECDEAEKSSPVVDKNTKPKRAATLKPDRKLKASKQAGAPEEEEALKSTGPEETMTNCGETLKKPSRKKKESENEAGESTSVSARKLKIGTEMTAKVQQVRTHGLVLDLGGGIRGMYKFEVCLLEHHFLPHT